MISVQYMHHIVYGMTHFKYTVQGLSLQCIALVNRYYKCHCYCNCQTVKEDKDKNFKRSHSSYLGQVFHRLGFARGRGSDQGSAQVQAQGPGEGEPAAVGERGDDQARGAALVLIAVGKRGLGLHHVAERRAVVPVVQ